VNYSLRRARPRDPLDAPSAESLLRLVDELEAGNAQFNLTAIRDRLGCCANISSTASVGSLTCAVLRLADIGTGAGFSRLALAIRQSIAAFYAGRGHRQEGPIRRTNRAPLRGRQRQVEHARAELWPSNFSIQWWLGAILPGGLCGLCRHLCAPDGRLLANEGQAAGRGNLRPAQAFACWRCIGSRCPGWTTSGILWNSHCPDPNRVKHEAGHRSRKSKGGVERPRPPSIWPPR